MMQKPKEEPEVGGCNVVLLCQADEVCIICRSGRSGLSEACDAGHVTFRC